MSIFIPQKFNWFIRITILLLILYIAMLNNNMEFQKIHENGYIVLIASNFPLAFSKLAVTVPSWSWKNAQNV